MTYKAKASELTEYPELIEAANKRIDLSEWTIEVWNVTPAEALSVIGLHCSNTQNYDADRIGIGGTCNGRTKTIRLFYEGEKSNGSRRWTLAHELGHAVHHSLHPESKNWTSERKEAEADRVGLELEDEAYFS